MIAKHRLQFFMIAWDTARFQNGMVAGKIGMQAELIHGDHVRVALATCRFWIITRIGDDPLMGYILVVGCFITFMAIDTGNLPVHRIRVAFAIY
jgi:hypothetical protein